MPNDIEKGTMPELGGALTRTVTAAVTDSLTPIVSKEVQDELSRTGSQLEYELVTGDEDDPVNLERVLSEHSIANETVGANVVHSPSGKVLPAFGLNKVYPPVVEREMYTVEFNGADDPSHPLNYPTRQKVRTLIILGYSTLSVAWGSSIFSSATFEVAERFGVSITVAILGLSLYVLGFASGPLLWAPFSELKGRRLPLIVGIFGFALFNTAVATAKDLQTIMICRFFAGFFGASALTVVPAVMADIVTNRWRGTAMASFASAVFVGPLLAPVVGGFIVNSLGWRWTEYITCIMGWFALCLILVFFRETYPPSVLVEKAAYLRRVTGNWAIHARQEQVELNLKDLLEKNFTRPIRMLILEPILLLVTIYTAFIYGILYLLLEAYPIIFIEGYGMSATVGELPYLGMIVGELIGCAIVISFEPSTIRKIMANGGMPVPEARLLPTMVGALIFPIGMFWLTWAGAYHEHVHWIVPTLSGLFIGCGIILLFLSLLTYILESYLMFAASAMAANTVLRSGFGAGFPLFATGMFHNLKTQWAGTLLGCIGVALIPVPFVFYYWGPALRKYSKFAPKLKK
ncbi:major facilitator superfamily domain-containing protein [Dipodascopsis uninucleata]